MNPFKTPGAFSWSELNAADPAAAADFYSRVFGWDREAMQLPGMPPYTVIKAAGAALGGIGPLLPGQRTGWKSYVTVSDLDACLARVTAGGGKVCAPPVDVPTVGRMALIEDPQGGTLSAIQYHAQPAATPTLYCFAPSHHSRRVLAVAHSLGVTLKTEHRDLSKGEHRTADILAMNPNGWLPILVDGDVTLFESNAIMQYLADQYGPTSLYPEIPGRRGLVNQWLSWQMCHFGPATGPFVYERLVKGLLGQGVPDEARLDKVAVDFLKHATVLDGALQRRTYVCGDDVTLADFAIASNLMYAEMIRIPWDAFAALRAWYGRVTALDAWVRTAPAR